MEDTDKTFGKGEGSFPDQDEGSSTEKIAGSVPGKDAGSFPGQVAESFPGPISASAPGQDAGSFPGQVAGGFPGQVAGVFPGQVVGGFPGQAAGGFPGQAVGCFPGQTAGMFHGQAAGMFHGQAPGGLPAGNVPGQLTGSYPSQLVEMSHTEQPPPYSPPYDGFYYPESLKVLNNKSELTIMNSLFAGGLSAATALLGAYQVLDENEVQLFLVRRGTINMRTRFTPGGLSDKSNMCTCAEGTMKFLVQDGMGVDVLKIERVKQANCCGPSGQSMELFLTPDVHMASCNFRACKKTNDVTNQGGDRLFIAKAEFNCCTCPCIPHMQITDLDGTEIARITYLQLATKLEIFQEVDMKRKICMLGMAITLATAGDEEQASRERARRRR